MELRMFVYWLKLKTGHFEDAGTMCFIAHSNDICEEFRDWHHVWRDNDIIDSTYLIYKGFYVVDHRINIHAEKCSMSPWSVPYTERKVNIISTFL